MNDTTVWLTPQYEWRCEWQYSVNEEVTLCFTPSQPVRLYQGYSVTDATVLMTLRYELHNIMNYTTVWMTPHYECLYSMRELTLQYECHYGMNGIMMWMTLQYKFHYSMNDTTVLITSVNTFNCLQEITSLFLVSPGNSVQFPWQPRYRHRAEWRQADSMEDGRQRGRNSDVTWPHGGEHGVWGKQPVSDVIAITIMLIMWRNL